LNIVNIDENKLIRPGYKISGQFEVKQTIGDEEGIEHIEQSRSESLD